ncbi:RHS repeat-associated core domain-containing protein [Prosthecobacter sp.]|uniref:RHS repeat-associated core domain-containing protein n=1 Tax=Prosthecobacter sp. TaxID=1965333 RepID=UPI003782FDCD
MNFTVLPHFKKAGFIGAGFTILLSIAWSASAQTALPEPTSGKFVFPFQSSDDPTYQAFVVPLDFQTGVQTGQWSNIPWGGATSKDFDMQYLIRVDSGNTLSLNPTNSPLAYFGSAVGASTMYEEMSYRFVLHTGDAITTGSAYNDNYGWTSGLEIKTFAKSDISAGNISSSQSIYLALPFPFARYIDPVVSASATTTTNSTTVTVPSTASLSAGENVSGPGIPAGTTVAAKVNATTLTLSAPATATGTNVTLTFGGWRAWQDAFPQVSVTGTSVTAGSTSVTVPSTAGMGAGESVSGQGIAVGVVIVSVDSSTSLTISAPAVSNGNGTLVFGGPGAWTAFGDRGYQATVSVNVPNGTGTLNVLDTVVQIVLPGNGEGKWGDNSIFSGPLLVTHKAHAGAEQYYFMVNSIGGVQAGGNAYYMSYDQDFNPTKTMGYGLNFDAQSPWSSKLLTTPSFQGTPMPPAYYGKSATEIESQAAPVQLLNIPAPTSGQFANVGTTPELQQHSALDQFVAQMGNNPMALAAYVQNQIGLTDALSYNNQGDLNETSVNAGGMERAAVGTFLEGQGSPEEQCALLVYLLRKAGYKAAYVVPQRNSLQLADQRLSNLLRMRIAGAMSPDGTHPVPQFIYCNYPFVAAYLPANGTSGSSKWVPLFPWLKDTDVEQGLNVNNYLPNGATDIRQWVRNFLLARSDSTMWDSDSSPLTTSNLSCGTTTGSPVVTVPSTAGLIVGQTVKGAGIPAGALIASVGDASGTRTLSCSTTNGSTSVMVQLGIGTVGLAVGQTVSGNGISSGTTIAAVNSSTTLTLSTAATATSGSSGLTFGPPAPVSSTPLCFITAGSPTVTMYPYNGTTTAGLSVGMSVSGNGIPAGTTVTVINSTSTLTLSANATATYNTVFSPVYLTFTSVSTAKPTVVLTKNATATASAASLTFQSWDRTPGGFFIKSLADNLQKSYPGISVADLGVSFLDRKYNYTGWDQFPQPIPVKPAVTRTSTTASGSTSITVNDATGLVAGLAVSGSGIAAGTTVTAVSGTTLTLSAAASSSSSSASLTFGTSYSPSETLTGDSSVPVTADRALYDTVDISITSDQNPSKSVTLSGVRIMDLHNRRAVVNFIPGAVASAGSVNNYTLIFSLAPYDVANPDSGTGSFAYGASGDLFMRRAQQASLAVNSSDQSFSLSVVYHRNRSYKGAVNIANAALGGWRDFLNIIMTDFDPNSATLSSTTTSGSSTVTIPSGTGGLIVGSTVSGTGIPAGAYVAGIASGTTITLSAPATASGTVSLKYAGGTGSTPPSVSSFFLGDLNSFCLNTGRVTPAMLNVHMQYYNQLQQQIQTAASADVPAMLDSMQGSLAYLMGMTYYQRMSTSMDGLKNLFQVNTVSTRAHGFGQFGAQKARNTSTGALLGDNLNNPLPLVVTPANTPSGTYRIQQTFPKVDMNFLLETHAGYDDLRTDAGGQGTVVTPDFYFNLMIAQGSSLESQTIAQYFDGQNTDAISTFSLLQKVQLGLNGAANPDIIELSLGNYSALGATNYTVNGVTKSLSAWAGGATAGSMWSSIVTAFNRWDANEVRVYLTPGDSIGANGQWKGMVALIIGRDQAGALIGSLNSLNGGVASSIFDLESSNVSAITLKFDASSNLDAQSIIASVGSSSGVSRYSYYGGDLSNSNYITYSGTSSSTSLVTTPIVIYNNTVTGLSPTIGSILNTGSSGFGSLFASPAGGFSSILTPAAAQNQAALLTIVNSAPGVSLYTGDPVNTMTGELYADEADLTLPGPLPLQIRRNYSSRSLSAGEFGYGWKAGMFPFLVTYTSGGVSKVQAAEMDGTVITYTQAAGSTTSWVVSAADNPLLSNGSGMSLGSVRNPFYNTITLSGTVGSNGATYTLKGADGSVRVYTVKSFPLGTVTRQRPYLTSWTDSAGNSLNFYYYGDGSSSTPKPWYGVGSTDPAYGQLAFVQASNGNSVSFTYDAYGHITNIATADGRQLTYTYDANGDLRQVDFPDGSWTQYEYLIQIGKVGTSNATAQYSTHLISQETRPGGRRVQTYYVKFQTGDLDESGATVAASRVGNDVSTARRVDYQLASVGKGDSSDVTKPVSGSEELVKNAQYYYYLTTDTSGYITGRTEIVDAYDRKTIYYYVNSRLVQIMDPLSTVTNVTTGAGSNPKMVQTWYTAADVTNNVTGAWAGGLRSIYQRGGTLTTFQYNSTGDVIQTSVAGYLDGASGPASGTPITVTSTSTTGPGPVLGGFVSNNTAVTTATYSTDGRHLPLTVTHPHPVTGAASGTQTVFTYDSARPYFVSQVAEYDSPAQTNLLSASTSTYQDVTSGSIFANGLPNVVTAAAGTSDAATTTWTYNANGFPTQKVSASGQNQATNPDSVVQFSYDLRGQLYQEQVMSGGSAAKTNLYAYDEMGRPIWVERRDSSGKQVGWNYTYYNLNGDVEWTQGSRLEPADYSYTSYDGAGRPVEKTTWRSRAKADGSGVEAVPGAAVYATSIYSYNMFGDLLGVTDPLGNSVKASYDAIGRKTGSAAYQGNWQTGSTTVLATTYTSYDDVELSVTSTDARGGVTKVYATSDGKPRLKVNPDGTQLTWSYYLDGRVKRQPISATTYVEITYNDVTRTVTKTTKNTTNSETFTETATADRRGNIVSATDVASFTTTATYDGLNRPMTATVPASGSTSAARSLTHAYDAAGFMHKITDAAGVVTETDADALGRAILTKVSSGAAVVSQSSVSYSSDFQSVTTTSGAGAGAVSETVWTDLNGHTVLVKHADGSTAAVTYDAAGNAVAATNETGQTTTSTYDGLQRLLTSTLPDGATTQFVYTYPAGGGQTTERRMPGSLTEFTQVDAVGRPVESYLKGTGNALTRHYTNYAYYTSGKEQGLLQSFTDPNGYSHSVTYDAWLRPTTTSAGTAGTEAYVYREFLSYDPRGMALQVRETTSTGVSQIDSSYDGQGHLYDEKVSLGSSAGSLAAVTDLSATYDNVGRRATLARGSAITSVGASGGAWGFQYRADGLLREVDIAGGAFNYTYGNNGLLQTRSNPFRNFSVSDRDSRGRIVNSSTALVNGGATVVSENISSWSFDNKQIGYSCWHQSSDLPGAAAAWTDSRSYSYSTQRRQLTGETWTNSPDKTVLNASITGAQTLSYTFDGGAAGGLGVRTRALTTTAGTTQQHLISAQDAWARGTGETGGFEKRFPFTVQGTAVGAASVDLRVGPKASLNQVNFPDATAMTTGAWSRDLSLPAGSYALNAVAKHPSGQFSNQTSSSFTLAVKAFGVSETYDDVGNVKTRTVTDGTYTRTQTLTWDAVGRLMSVVQTDNSSLGQAFTWTATYDARSRRIQARTQFTSGGPQAGRTLTETSWYDPLVEFLEVGLEVSWGATGGSITSHERWWKVHGPDLSGGYGGLQGMGGLEAMVNEVTGEAVGFVDDTYGHILGFAAAPGVTSGSAPANAFVGITATFEWNVGRFGGYGPLPGYWSAAIADGVATWRTFGWRGKRMEVTGYYHLGARYYESGSGRFLSADPLGHGASMSLYDYAGADPINFVDPRGRSPGSTAAVINTPYGDRDFSLLDWSQTNLGNIVSDAENPDVSMGFYAEVRFRQQTAMKHLYPSGEEAGGYDAVSRQMWEEREELKEATKEFAAEIALLAITEGASRWFSAGKVLLPSAGRVASGTAVRSITPYVFRGTTTWEVEAAEAAYAKRLAANRLATRTDEAVFWSGIGKKGVKGEEVAAQWVAKNGGQTLETLIAERGIVLPTWDANNPAVVAAWKQVSVDLASGAAGNVRVLQGPTLRSDAIFGEEYKALIENPDVMSIRAINPETGVETLLWSR